MNKKQIFILILVCFLIVLTRLPYLGTMPHEDEYIWIVDAIQQDYMVYMTPHPPLSIWIYISFFNISHYLRFVPLIFGMITFIFGYLIIKKITENKTAHRWYFILFVLSFWNALANLQMDIDGAILTALIAISLFFFMKFEEKNKSYWYFLSSIIFGLALLTKATGLFIIIIIGFYVLLKTRSLKKTLSQTIPMFIIGLCFFSIFPIFYHGVPRFNHILFHAASFSVVPSFLHLAYLFIWGTPLLIILFLMGSKIFSEKTRLIVLWVLIPIIMYSFGRAFSAPFDRYLMVIILPLLILGSIVISNFLKRKDELIVAEVSIILFVVLMIFNPSYKYIIHSFKDYFINIITFKWNFLLPITGPSGPLFGIPVLILMIVSILSVICFLFIIFNKYPKIAFILFLSIGLAYNAYCINLLEFNTNQPNINQIKIEMLKNMNSFTDLYTNEKSLTIFFSDIKIIKDEKILDGNIFVLDYPPRKELSRYDNCELIKEYQDFNQTFGYHYKCEET